MDKVNTINGQAVSGREGFAYKVTTLYNNIHRESKAKKFIVYDDSSRAHVQHEMACLDALYNYDDSHTMEDPL